MNDTELLERKRIETARWRILKVLDAGRPTPVAEQLILGILGDVELNLSQSELRRELDYLRDRKLVSITGERTHQWSASLTHHGVDIVGYCTDCFPGIARPQR